MTGGVGRHVIDGCVLKICSLVGGFNTFLKATLLLFLAVAVPAALMPAVAQQAGRTITIVVPYTAGTGIDIVARLSVRSCGSAGDNRSWLRTSPAPAATSAPSRSRRSAPDGHTLMVAANTFVMNASLFKSVPYDPQRASRRSPRWQPGRSRWGAPLGGGTMVRALIDGCQGAPGKDQLRLAGAPKGQHGHGTLQAHRRKSLDHVPYSRLGRCRRDLVGGHVSAMFLPLHTALPLVAGQADAPAGHRRRKRSRLRPTPDARRGGRRRLRCRPLVRPAGAGRNAAPEIVGRYNTEINDILTQPDVRDALASRACSARGGAPEGSPK